MSDLVIHDDPSPSPTVTLRPCGCGCPALVSRRFLPGHDARLKGQLLRRIKSPRPAERYHAAQRLRKEGWLHFVKDLSLYDAIPTRQRWNVPSVAITSLTFAVVDARKIAHSRYCCPAAATSRTVDGVTSTGRFVRQVPGDPPLAQQFWTCGLCTHTESFAQEARREIRHTAALKGLSQGTHVLVEAD